MKLLVLIHRDDTALEAFMAAVREKNLGGFTLLRSNGIGRTSQKHPLEFGLMSLLTGESGRLENSTVLSFLEDENLAQVLGLLKTHIQDLGAPGGGMYAVLPVESWGGIE